MTDAEHEARIRKTYRGLQGDMPPFGDVLTPLRLLDEPRAEIARLQLRPEDLLRCLITKNVCGTDTWTVGHPCQCENCQRWLRLQAPPGASAMERAEEIISTFILEGRFITQGMPSDENRQGMIAKIARALEQAAREARAAALEEAEQAVMAEPHPDRRAIEQAERAVIRIRALAAKPQEHQE